MSRSARVERKTKESEVLVELELDGTGQVEVSTGVPFFDHMLTQLGRHGGFDLTVRTVGDLQRKSVINGGKNFVHHSLAYGAQTDFG